MRFIGGITGQFFRQFAVTIAVSTVISAFNSLTLSPALAASDPQAARRHAGSARPGCSTSTLGWFFRAVQPGVRHRDRDLYVGWSAALLRVTVVVLLVYGGLLGADLVRFSTCRPASSRSRTRAICC